MEAPIQIGLGEYSLSNNCRSPFRYPGGKFYARKLILSEIPPHTAYCEPFLGGGSIFFAKDSSKVNILNDVDEDLMNCYRWIRNDVEALIAKLEGIPAKKELHGYYKNVFKPDNDLERAMRWFYLNRTSYSGIMKIDNCYWGYGDKYSMRPENWPRHLRKVSDKLQGATLLQKDFVDLIDFLDGITDLFLFIDPPYFNADQDKFYTCSFSKEDHLRLLTVLKRIASKHHFLITYDNSPEIIEMYQGWCNISNQEWNYAINRTDDQKTNKKLIDGYRGSRTKGKEVFITNY